MATGSCDITAVHYAVFFEGSCFVHSQNTYGFRVKLDYLDFLSY